MLGDVILIFYKWFSFGGREADCDEVDDWIKLSYNKRSHLLVENWTRASWEI